MARIMQKSEAVLPSRGYRNNSGNSLSPGHVQAHTSFASLPRIGDRNTIQPMKSVFAALLLVFQLQPLLGTAACLGFSAQAAQQGCEMPEHGVTPHSTVAQTGSPAQSCELASMCASSPLAIPGLNGTGESLVPLHEGAAIPRALTQIGVSSAPPFHPPKV